MKLLADEFEKKKYKIAKDLIKNKQISKGLKHLIKDINLLTKKGLNKKEILEFIEAELEVNIPIQSFYTFWRRYLTKSNIEENSNNFDDVIIKNDTQISTPEPAPKVVEREAQKVVKKVVEKQTKKEVKKDVKKDVETTQKNDKNDSASSSITKEKLDKLANTDIDINQFL